MNTSSLINQINEALAALGGGPFLTTKTAEEATKTTVTGTLGDSEIHIEFIEEGNGTEAEKDHTVVVVDGASGERLGEGRGDSTFADAISSFGWAGVLDAVKNG
ncbi:MAG TPA: hypothetical protein VNJ54_19210 [Plantibacter sp.]|uniref:hypothetical protein n=1 Tax=unclassified Plantibacter TaxID=2624265 RepID=UPI002D1E028B|nr:hypothetical protein [Plantibacter sp.]